MLEVVEHHLRLMSVDVHEADNHHVTMANGQIAWVRQSGGTTSVMLDGEELFASQESFHSSANLQLQNGQLVWRAEGQIYF